MRITSVDCAGADLTPSALDEHGTAPNETVEAFRAGLAKTCRSIGLYRSLLKGAPTPDPRISVAPLWPGDPAYGRSFLSGRLDFGRGSADLPENPWNEAWPQGVAEDLHSFVWLSHLSAVGGSESAGRARSLTASWIAAFAQDNKLTAKPVWDLDQAVTRFRSILYHWPLLADGAATNDRDALRETLGLHLRHLGWVAGREGAGHGRLSAILALIHGGLLLPGVGRPLDKAIGLLELELSRAILPDGCHATRSPRIHAEVLQSLLELRHLFQTAQAPVPLGLVTAIDRMAPVLRFFRHGDGGLALFNDTREGDAAALDTLLGQADAKGRAPKRCPHGGFERLTSGKLAILLDAGAPPAAPYDGHSHAGPLSMEISYGAERLIVNCGASRAEDPAWTRAQRSTAAHSTLGVADTNADELGPDNRLGKRRASTVVERNEAEQAVWVAMSHDGYTEPFGLTHKRRLYLAADGRDLRGEDVLEGPEGHTFTIRFHLHPSVQVSLLGNQAAALLKTPSGSGWRLRMSGAEISLTDSIYLGGSQDTKRTQQILLTGVTAPGGSRVKWALQRESKR